MGKNNLAEEEVWELSDKLAELKEMLTAVSKEDCGSNGPGSSSFPIGVVSGCKRPGVSSSSVHLERSEFKQCRGPRMSTLHCADEYSCFLLQISTVPRRHRFFVLHRDRRTTAVACSSKASSGCIFLQP